MNKVIVLYAPDGYQLYQSIKEQLEEEVEEKIEVTDQLQPMPESWETIVVLFVITSDALKDTNLIDYAKEAVKRSLPLLPTVEDLTTYNFRNIPASLTILNERNAISIKPVAGATLVEAVKGYLGFESFAKNKKVFISYRRTDTSSQAELVYQYLWQNKFQVFKDTEHIAGGAVVQEEIMEEIGDKDFVLFFDSPDVLSSNWVMEEIKAALLHRIPVCSVRFQDRFQLNLVDQLPSVKWDIKDPNLLPKICMMVSRAIASRTSLDTRVKRTLQQSANLKSIYLTELDTRQILLTRNNKRVLLEFEDAPVSLERLHRLHNSYNSQNPCEGAIFICGDHPLLVLTKDAVKWARGSKPLEISQLVDINVLLDHFFK